MTTSMMQDPPKNSDRANTPTMYLPAGPNARTPAQASTYVTGIQEWNLTIIWEQLCQQLPHDYQHYEAVAKEFCESECEYSIKASPAHGPLACVAQLYHQCAGLHVYQCFCGQHNASTGSMQGWSMQAMLWMHG
jgi:hypothetical protein